MPWGHSWFIARCSLQWVIVMSKCRSEATSWWEKQVCVRLRGQDGKRWRGGPSIWVSQDGGWKLGKGGWSSKHGCPALSSAHLWDFSGFQTLLASSSNSYVNEWERHFPLADPVLKVDPLSWWYILPVFHGEGNGYPLQYSCLGNPMNRGSLPATVYGVTVRHNWVTNTLGFPGDPSGKEPTCQWRRHEMWVGSLGWKDSLEEGIATHSRILAWKVPWTKEPGGLYSIMVAKSLTAHFQHGRKEHHREEEGRHWPVFCCTHKFNPGTCRGGGSSVSTSQMRKLRLSRCEWVAGGGEEGTGSGLLQSLCCLLLGWRRQEGLAIQEQVGGWEMSPRAGDMDAWKYPSPMVDLGHWLPALGDLTLRMSADLHGFSGFCCLSSPGGAGGLFQLTTELWV